VGLATVQYGGESVPLPAVCPLIDDRLTLAVALVDWSWPGVEKRTAETVERHVSKVTLIDPHHREAAAVSVRGARRLELAGTRVVAVAIAELDTFDVPVNLLHGVPPQKYRLLSTGDIGPPRTRKRLVKNLDFTTEGGCRTLAA
jgi:hypothetical protein